MKYSELSLSVCLLSLAQHPLVTLYVSPVSHLSDLFQGDYLPGSTPYDLGDIGIMIRCSPDQGFIPVFQPTDMEGVGQRSSPYVRIRQANMVYEIPSDIKPMLQIVWQQTPEQLQPSSLETMTVVVPCCNQKKTQIITSKDSLQFVRAIPPQWYNKEIKTERIPFPLRDLLCR